MSARNQILPLFIPHLGCPHRCVFCNQTEITAADQELALEILRDAAGNSDILHEGTELAFYGGSFTALPADVQLRFLEAAGKVMEKGKVTSLRLSTRPDAVDAETLERLKKYGVKTIELGAQSMRDEVLRLSGRGHTSEDVRRASAVIHAAGFQLVLQMMTGLPGDDDEGAVETAGELIALKPDAVRIYPTVVVRGTELERLWRCGKYTAHNVEDAVRICAKILPMFDAAGIPVIRLGLNPTRELSGGAALAGAYHPALGELVRSRILRNQAEEKIERLLGETDISPVSGDRSKKTEILLRVPQNKLSQMIGQKGSNRIWLAERFPSAAIQIEGDSEAEELTVRLQ